MNYYCPKCESSLHIEDDGNPLPAVCPECGADLYPEEVAYQQMVSSGQEITV